MVMLERNRIERIISQPIIEIETNKEIMNTYIYLENQRFQIRRKKERPVMCKRCINIQRSIVRRKKSTVKSVQGLCKRERNNSAEE